MEGAVAVARDHPLSPARERARANNISEALSAILPDSGVRNKSIEKCFLGKNGIGPEKQRLRRKPGEGVVAFHVAAQPRAEG